MDKKYLAILLVTLVAGEEVNTVTTNVQELPSIDLYRDYRNQVSKLRPILATVPYELILLLFSSRTQWDGHVLYANVNDIIDYTVRMVPLTEDYGLDPMQLPDVVQGFVVRIFMFAYKGWLRFYHGYMTGLVNVTRSGDQYVYFFDKMMELKIELRFTDLQINYKYLVNFMNLIGLNGKVVGKLDHIVTKSDLIIDFNKQEIQLQEFFLTEVSQLDVRLVGNNLTDALVNPVMGTFVNIFDNSIIYVVERNLKNAALDAIAHLNNIIKESFINVDYLGYI